MATSWRMKLAIRKSLQLQHGLPHCAWPQGLFHWTSHRLNKTKTKARISPWTGLALFILSLLSPLLFLVGFSPRPCEWISLCLFPPKINKLTSQLVSFLWGCCEDEDVADGSQHDPEALTSPHHSEAVRTVSLRPNAALVVWPRQRENWVSYLNFQLRSKIRLRTRSIYKGLCSGKRQQQNTAFQALLEREAGENLPRKFC